MLNFMMMGATVRVFVELFKLVSAGPAEFRRLLTTMMISLFASWILVIGASASMGASSILMLQAARAADIFALITGLFALQTNFSRSPL